MGELTKRKRDLLRRVVEEYVATGEPVGSKTLVERSGLAVSSSTVRNELAELEALGLLTHPHTSAGRVPTEAGYRFYAEGVLERQESRPARFPLDLTAMRSEVEDALQSTTEMLSQVTRLLALVSAPRLETASVRRVEVLLLQPSMVMVVTITSSGGVALRRRRGVPARRRARRRARSVPAAPLRARAPGRRARADDRVLRRPPA